MVVFLKILAISTILLNLSSDTSLAISYTSLIVSDVALAGFNIRSKKLNPPNCIILDKWVFEKCVLADEPFAKVLRSLEICALVNNNLWRHFDDHVN